MTTTPDRVTIDDAPDRVERRSIVIDAEPEAIFDLLADPRRHGTFDGSGTVQDTRVSAPDRLSDGAKFGMKMKLGPLPYTISNTVIEFEEGRRIAWRHLGRHVWRYVLEPVDGGTKVTEEFDWGASVFPPALQLAGYPVRNARSIEQTLLRLAEVVETDG